MKMKYLLLFTVIGLAFFSVTATTVIPPTFDQLVQQAELIFQGTVTGVRSAWEGEGAQRHINTYVTFQIAENVKGDAGTSYTIRMLGGTVGDETMEVTDTPNSMSAIATFSLSSTTTSSSFHSLESTTAAFTSSAMSTPAVTSSSMARASQFAI